MVFNPVYDAKTPPYYADETCNLALSCGAVTQAEFCFDSTTWVACDNSQFAIFFLVFFVGLSADYTSKQLATK